MKRKSPPVNSGLSFIEVTLDMLALALARHNLCGGKKSARVRAVNRTGYLSRRL